MLLSLVNNNSSITSVQIGVISDIKFQLDHLHLEHCFIKQKQETYFQHWCKLSYLCWERNNIQHLMRARAENKDIYFHSYIQEWFQTFTLYLWLFIICPLTMVYRKDKADIKCWICISAKVLYYRINAKKFIPTNILSYLIIYTCSISAAVIEDIAKI